MARSDIITKLVQHGAEGDHESFRRAAEALISDERAKRHHILADRLAAYLHQGSVKPQNGKNGANRRINGDNQKIRQIVHEVWPKRRLANLILSNDIRRDVEELIEEHQRANVLRSYGMEPRHRLLLVGPPGNGKTTLAEAIAESLACPLYVVQYDGLVGSFLGETSGRLRQLFDFARTEPAVLFFDEFDTIGKERGDEHEVGEIKRVVSTLLMQIDELPSHTIIVVASNHPELLDRAAWRRFQLRIELPRPGKAAIRRWLERFGERAQFTWPRSTDSLARHLQGLSFAEVEDFTTDVYRRYILSLPDARPKDIVDRTLARLKRQARASDQDTTTGGHGGRAETDPDFSGNESG